MSYADFLEKELEALERRLETFDHAEFDQRFQHEQERRELSG